MGTKSGPMLTRKLKREVIDDPDSIQKLDQQTQEQLKHLTKAKTPSSHGNIDKILSQSSHTSTKSKLSGSTVHLRQQLESTVWVQCDNQDCFKWRRVTAAELVGVTEDSKWFCSMNKTPDFASCDVPEEDTAWYDKAAKRVGLCYVKTPLVEGSLVWAKMVGYCKWPGIVTKDPGIQLHSLVNVDGEPLWYHVEFLGGSHTHSWVRAKGVKLFTLQSSSLIGPVVSRKGFRGYRKRFRKKLVSSMSKPTERKHYKNGVSVDDACTEANTLIDLSNTERLNMCSFINICNAGVVEVTAGDNVQDVADTEPKDAKRTKLSVKQRLKEKKKIENSVPIDNHFVSYESEELCLSVNDRHSLPHLDLKFSDSLVDHSKEEKLVLDVQMYQRNERAFEHDVLRFMKRNEMAFRGLPRWQNTSISLFQLFLAVHERGGYEQICSVRGGWVQVYKELTECHNSGDVAKKYYKRNLYPYELYIKGKDFKKALPAKYRCGRKKKESKDQRAFYRKIEVQSDLDEFDSSESLMESELAIIHSCLDQDSGLLSSEVSVDLMEMLGDLENSGNLCSLEDDVLMTKAKLGIDITFFDQSPPRPSKDSRNIKEASTASEFGSAFVPSADDNAQEVPDVSVYSQSTPDQLLHEMQALQDGIDLIAGEMDFL